MNKTIDWINILIKDIVDPSIKLKDTLLKVKVLAFNLKNSKLEEWVENELNGYKDNNVPAYRTFKSIVYGNLIQDRGLGVLTQNHYQLPIEYLDQKIRDSLKETKMRASVSELEHMKLSGEEYAMTIPHVIYSEFSKILANDWVVNSAWISISSNSIEGILGSIKSDLLTFLLKLSEEIGENENIDIMEHKSKIDSLFDNTIGHLSGETVNITIGSDNTQIVNSGSNAKFNISKGDNVNQTMNVEAEKELAQFVGEIKSLIDKLEITSDDKLDLENEIHRIDSQLARDIPKYPIINQALNVINGILIGVAGNVVTPAIVDKLHWLIGQFV
jgi:hypothetical protein